MTKPATTTTDRFGRQLTIVTRTEGQSFGTYAAIYFGETLLAVGETVPFGMEGAAIEAAKDMIAADSWFDVANAAIIAAKK